MNQIKKIPHNVLYDRYCSMCDDFGVQHPPKSIVPRLEKVGTPPHTWSTQKDLSDKNKNLLSN